ncbi:MAG: VOC family protein, partial [Jiangellaceae bacterium]
MLVVGRSDMSPFYKMTLTRWPHAEGMTNTGVPIPAGYHSLTPYLAVDHAADAIDFYRVAFGAQQISRMDNPGGGVMMAVLRIGDSNFELGDPSPDFGTVAPNGQGVSSSVMIY